MKKLVIAMLFLVAFCGVATAETYIGMFDNMEATICYGDTETYVIKSIYFIAYLEPEIAALTAVEFCVPNLPESGDLGLVTPNWATELVIGSLDWGISLAFTTPVAGPLAYLGEVGFFPIDAGWIGLDYRMDVAAAQDSGNLVIVDDSYVTFPVRGGMYTFNCSNPADCDCLDSVPTASSSWSTIKALY